MTYKVEAPHTEFKFWSGAKSTVKYLTSDELDTIEFILELEDYVYTETDINDFFWFETDTIAEWLGYNSFDEIMDRYKEEA